MPLIRGYRNKILYISDLDIAIIRLANALSSIERQDNSLVKYLQAVIATSTLASLGGKRLGTP